MHVHNQTNFIIFLKSLLINFETLYASCHKIVLVNIIYQNIMFRIWWNFIRSIVPNAIRTEQ